MTATEQDGAQAEAERPLLGPVVKRRRRSSVPDPVLAEAVETARGGVLEITDAATIGTAHQLRVEEDRLLTHLFECLLPGYRGWFWYSTVARAPRSKTVTVCEVGLLPGDDALLAPAWVPWADRVRPEELDREKEESGEGSAGEDTSNDGEASQSGTEEGGADGAADAVASSPDAASTAETPKAEAADDPAPEETSAE
ncbi:DUF3027 domain-containing protein [Rothia halotolerans]|uniref:DUF3027 domain-containing protein n=1 Tax=Rothia halotolerans TaxID=405770 RepID=UPI00101CB7CF|nr:DUF3027 domain-containing protein [Rothia halotolerans]